jgi:nitrogen regulatory protein PII
MNQPKLITCILAKGKAAALQHALIEERGIYSANIHHGRGVGRFAPLSERGVGEQLEKEIVEICIDGAIADEIFEFVFFAAEINQPHGGVIYMIALQSASEFKVPEIPDED